MCTSSSPHTAHPNLDPHPYTPPPPGTLKRMSAPQPPHATGWRCFMARIAAASVGLLAEQAGQTMCLWAGFRVQGGIGLGLRAASVGLLAEQVGQTMCLVTHY